MQNVNDYTQKQKWLYWLQCELIKQYSNGVDISLYSERTPIITHVYNSHEKEKLYTQDYTIAFLLQHYSKIMREILTLKTKQQKEEAKRIKEEIEQQKQLEQVNNAKMRIYTKLACILLIIPLTILYMIFL